MAKKSKLTPIHARKELLVAESELNRLELIKDLDHLKNEFNRVKRQTVVVGSVLSSVGLLATVASVFRRGGAKHSNGSAEPKPKAPWLATALEGARLGTSVFMKIRSILRERERDRH